MAVQAYEKGKRILSRIGADDAPQPSMTAEAIEGRLVQGLEAGDVTRKELKELVTLLNGGTRKTVIKNRVKTAKGRANVGGHVEGDFHQH
ncbi:hypothetical protein [Terrabacter sp. NPDC000476]|uniref:hypothetical protein n=1 Tax=Terrabacter sp. NPDC000476 TaxID=3154258 RepID=UPI00333296DF